MIEVVVLDAMGVIYQAADDVAELLVPFCRARGGEADAGRIEAAYRAASLGEIGPDAFWGAVGLTSSVEADYLAGHALAPGALDFLDAMAARGAPVWMLSNDVGRWSAALRRRFDLERRLAGAAISADIGARKPDPAAYAALLDRAGVAPEAVLFADDRPGNVAAAAAMGIRAVGFGPASATGDPRAADFGALAALVGDGLGG